MNNYFDVGLSIISLGYKNGNYAASLRKDNTLNNEIYDSNI